MRLDRLFAYLFALSFVSVFGAVASAVPYASSVRNTSGSSWEFVLNEAADAVTVLRNGANPVNLGALAAGRHTFDMTGFSTFDIQVQKSAPAGWTSITDPTNPFDDFTIPSGVIVNKSPSNLAYFGTVYVSQAATAATKSGRAMGDGIYALSADMKGVDLAGGFAPVANSNDTTQAKHPGFDVAGSTTSSPWRLSMDASGNLLVADWSDASGGVKYASRDLTSGGLVLGGVDVNGNPVPDGGNTGPAGGIFSQEMDAFGRLPLHGSSGGRVYSTGTVGVDLTLWTMDEDLDVDLAVPNNDTNSIWRYDIGSATNYDALAPTLVVNSKAIPTNSDSSVNLIGVFGPGVATGMLYSEQFGKWYVNQPRANGDTSASVAIISADLDGSDAAAPTLEWSSIQFTIDNGLDGDPTNVDPNNDVFRRVRDITISPDGKYLILHKNGADSGASVGLGDGAVFIVPLDENGIPDITVSGGLITNVGNITTLGDNGAHNSGAQVEFDAAGNLYVANSAVSTTSADPLLTGQLVQVFSPGGNTLATTSSTGMFSVVPLVPPGGVAGDYNDNGIVDAADYVVWRKFLGTNTQLENEGQNVTPGMVTQEDYNTWRANFGSTTPPGSASSLGAVPEPGTFILVILGLAAFGAVRRQA
jgi:PEP-CTERM motif